MKETIIQIQNVSKKFGENYALNRIDLTVQKGEIFGIIGMSGAGKSTLIRCLCGLEKPTTGTLYISGQELTTLDTKSLRAARKKIGMIFQHFNLFTARTALENVSFPLEISGVKTANRTQKIESLLSLVGIEGKKHLYPSQLSGGEKQRVAIARALAMEPDVLLCDEATSALDPQTTGSILDLLAELNQRLAITIVLITHEMEVIKRICSHVAVLEQGKIVEAGTTLQLFSSPKHPKTKRFLQNLTHELPEYLLPKKRDQEILRLSFTGKTASEPIITKLIRSYDIEVNILLGGIDVLRKEIIGNLVIALSGPSAERVKALVFLENCGVHCEPL
jgi:D-methionine transport system ATP-binding protein